jgi:hypothetical protein
MDSNEICLIGKMWLHMGARCANGLTRSKVGTLLA